LLYYSKQVYPGGIMMNHLENIRAYAIEKDIDIYLVGGAVRDRIMGIQISDFDFTLSGNCHEVAKGIAEIYNGSYVNMHGDVARVVIQGMIFDFSNLKGDDIYEDLKKRDFRINSIAIDMKTDKIIDVNNGVDDINNKVIKLTYPKGFEDDPVRLLRAVRLSSSLGFEIDEDTKGLMKEKAYLLKISAGERIIDEFYKILQSQRSHVYIKKLDKLNLLEIIFPIMSIMKQIGRCKYHLVDAYTHSLLTLTFLEENIEKIYNTKWESELRSHFNQLISGRKRICTTKLGAFLHDIGKPEAMAIDEGSVSFKGHEKTGVEEFKEIAVRLNISQDQREIVKSIISGHMRILNLFNQGATDRAIYRLFRDYKDCTIDVLVASLFDVTATRSLHDENGEAGRYWNFIVNLIDRYFESKQGNINLVNGRDVINLTGAEGGRIGEILRRVDEEIFYGNIKTRDEALELIKILKDVDNVSNQIKN
jgi:poly(A) polymerase